MAAQQLLPPASSLDVSIPNFGTFVPRRTKDADGPGTNLLRQYLCKESELFKKLNERREEVSQIPSLHYLCLNRAPKSRFTPSFAAVLSP